MKSHSLHIMALSMIVFGGATLGGCSPKGGGITVGSEAIPKSTEQVCYAFQLSPIGNSAPRTRYLFGVLWLAKQAGSAGGANNLLTEIHRHPISPDLSKKAVYALQPDYSLKELSLTPAEIDQLFSNVQKAQVSMMQETPPRTRAGR
ncbi:MAG: hypothetical protein ACLQNE_29395 [Thermoguttaceae bacterium]